MKRTSISLLALGALSLNFLSGCAPAVVAGGAAGAAAVAGDSRSTGTVIEDQAIEFRIANRLFSNPELAESAHIEVNCFNYIVLLTGEVPSESLRERAFEIASNDPNVRRVHNQLTVREALPLKARNYDIWLGTKAKAQLLADKDIEGLKMEVVVNDTVVYLLGIVTPEQADLAAKTVANVNGVTRVVKAFEYLQ